MVENEGRADHHGENRRVGRPRDAELEDEDENRIENDVGNRADENGRHAFVGVSFRPQLRREAEA